MATALYRLGRLAFRRRRTFVLAWVMVIVSMGIGASTLSGPTAESFTIPGTESQQALDLLTERTGAKADTATARAVFIADEGTTLTSPAQRRAIEAALAEITDLPNVASATDPFTTGTVSPDATTAFSTVSYTIGAVDVTPADQEGLFEAGRTAESASMSVEFGGEAVQEQGGTSATEAIGILVAALALLITFGGLVAAGLPLLTAIIGVTLGMLGFQIATGFFDMGSTTSTLAMMLGLAVGIDYALFIVSRFRHELLHGREPEEAAGRAVATAGSAVVFAGATVVIALAALAVVGLPFLTQMGLVAAGTVTIAVLVALTLLPAVLGFAGRRVLGRKGMAARDSESDDLDDARADASAKKPFGERWAGFVVRNRVKVLLVTVVGLAVVAVPAMDLRVALTSDAAAGNDTTQRKAYDAVTDAFGAGFNGPLVIVADLADSERPRQAAAAITSDLQQVDGLVAVSPATLIADDTTAIYSAIPSTGPSTAATEDLVTTIRSDAGRWEATTGAAVYVTGATAVGIDVSEKLSAALLPYLLIVVGLAFVLLALVFRSILVPLKAAGGFLLSVGAAFGAVVAVFEKGWGASLLGVDATGPIISFLPILLVGILFGLAMDYEVFLVTRMREEHVHGASPDESITLGFRHGARVVTAAAVIMVSVFAGFVTADQPVIKSIGFSLAVGIFVDAFVVRMTLVPAVMSLLGNRAWWLPAWLDRLLPNLDVEGARLTEQDAADAEHRALTSV